MQKPMRLLLVFVFNLAVCGFAQAQQGTPNAAAKTTSPAARLASKTVLWYEGGEYFLIDSTDYSYPGGRSGYFDPEVVSWVWEYDESKGIDFYGNNHMTQKTFDSYNNCVLSRLYYWDPLSGVWELASQQIFTYDALNNLVTETEQTWEPPTGTWTNYTKVTYTYTPDNKPATRINAFWTGAWENIMKFGYAYDAAGNRITELTENWDVSVSAWYTTNRTTSAYSADHDKVSDIAEYRDLTSGTWLNHTRRLYTSYVNHHPGTITTQSWVEGAGVFQNLRRETYVFNSYDLPEFTYGEAWTGTWTKEIGAQGTLPIRYHYEAITTSIAPSTDDVSRVSVYPVPAQNTLTIDISREEAEPVHIAIRDMQGKVCLAIDAPSCSQFTQAIPIEGLSAGMYVVTVSGQNGQVTKPITVVR